MAPPKKKKEKTPSMRELQDLLAALDAEGGLAIGGDDGAESTNLDELYEDSYFHAIFHNNIQQDSIELNAITCSAKDKSQQKDIDGVTQHESKESSPETHCFEVLTIPKGCSWGDDHESLGSRILVRPGYSTVLAALQEATDLSTGRGRGDSQSILMATGSSGIGKSCLVYYLVYKLFQAGYDIIVSDPMFTNAFLDRKYYSCYSPHLEKHPSIFQAISSAVTSTSTSTSSSKKKTLWICDDGFLPIQGTHCHVFITSSITLADKAVTTIHKEHKLIMPVQFQIPKWSLDEIKAGLIVSLSSIPGRESRSSLANISITKEQELVLQDLFTEFRGNPRKIFAWVKSNWVQSERDGSDSRRGKSATAKGKSNKARRS